MSDKQKNGGYKNKVKKCNNIQYIGLLAGNYWRKIYETLLAIIVVE